MQFDIVIKDDNSTPLKIRVKYGKTLRSVMTENGLHGEIQNQYGKPLPADMPLRGAATFIHLQST
jgi:hypothetical protein